MTKFLTTQAIFHPIELKNNALKNNVGSFSDTYSTLNSASFMSIEMIDEDTLKITNELFKKYNKAWKSLATK